MPNYKYKLQPYKGKSSRYTCPACGKRNSFTRYINTETNEQVSDTTGKCDREIKCGYHQTPKEYFETSGKDAGSNLCVRANTLRSTYARTPEPPCSYIAIETLQASRTHYSSNRLVQFLATVFDVAIVTSLIETYQIGTSAHWPGATVFWQIDKQKNIRTGKIMLYNAATGKRVKQPFNHVAWVHTTLKQTDYNLQQCLFGEHLLHKHPNKPVALVESEKTALIASVYFPDFVWLATGGLQGLNPERCKVLKRRQVTLFPDLKGYDKWKEKAKELGNLATITVSDLLEADTNEIAKAEGYDLADYLLKFDYKTYRAKQVKKQNAITPLPVPQAPQKRWVKPAYENKAEETKAPPVPHQSGWDIETLETFFAAYTPTTAPIQLSACETITNPANFISGHLEMVRHNRDKRRFKPYYERLVRFKDQVS